MIKKIKYTFLACLFIGFYQQEVHAQSQDVDITQIISPATCISNPGNQSVTVELTNNGATNLNGLPITLQFSIDGGVNFSFPEVFTPTALNTTGNTENFTFSQPANLNGAIDYTIVVRISPSIPGDNDLIDQLTTNVRVMTNFTLPSNLLCVDTDIGILDASNPTANSWQWNFGDGTTSNFQFNSHVYADTGTYTITLQSSNGVCTGTVSQTVIVQPPVADFSVNPQIGCAIPHTVFFTDQSTLPDTWFWNFGDMGPTGGPNTSTLQNPVHTYTSPGDYTISLVVTDTVTGCSSSQESAVSVTIPAADFTYVGATFGGPFGCGPLTVDFLDASSGSGIATSWGWNFGDGNTSNLQNPSHTYTTPGVYSVSLTTTYANGCFDVETKLNYVNVSGPNVDFAPSVTSGCTPLTVTFTDNTLHANTPTNYLWTFGDGNTLTNIGDVTHTYTTRDTFDVTLTVTDVIGCTASRTFNNLINTQDNTPPTITCIGNQTEYLDGTCQVILPDYRGLQSAADNCAIDSLQQSPAPGTIITANTIVTITAVDFGSNTASCSFNVSMMDTIKPTIVCPANIAMNNDPGQCGAIVTFSPVTGFDNCVVATTVQTSGLASGSLFPVGTTTNTFVVTDTAGNVDSCSFDVIITDTELPTISCPTNITQNNDLGDCTADVPYVAPTGADNCPGFGVALTGGLPPNATFPVGTTTNTYVVTDASGNTATCSFDVTVIDAEDPVISCPANITQNNDVGDCGAIVNFIEPLGTDNCPLSAGSTFLDSGILPGDFFPIGVTTNTYTVDDVAGNSTSCSFTVTVIDAEDPVINCPTNISRPNDLGACGAVVNYAEPVGTDNCPGDVTVQTAGLPDGSFFPIGTTTNTFEVTDAAGNVTICSFDVTVFDAESPVISCIGDIAQNNDPGVCGAVIMYNPPVGLDNCPGASTVQIGGLAPGSLFPVGVTNNLFEVTDANGNTDTCSFNIIITDTEFPTLSCPSDIAQNNDVGVCGATITYATPVGADNCPGSTTVQTAGLPSGGVFPIGTTVNTFEVTDASGNVTTCSFNVVISDTEFPTITCPANIAQNNDVGVCGAVINYTTPVGLDNCPASTTVQTAGLPDGSVFPIGTTTNTFEVTDASGNVTACSFDVVISDTEFPTLTCPSDITQSNDVGVCGATVNYTTPVGLDNCPGSTTVQTTGLPDGSVFPIGTTTNTFEVTDASGNITTCSFDVVINDTELPTITCPADIAQNNDIGQCSAVVTFTDPVGLDNCPGATTAQIAGLASGSAFPVGTTTNTFEVTDASGNTAMCSFDVVITDSELPTITCPADIAQNNDLGQCGAVVTFTAPVGLDNCPGSTTVQTSGLASGTLFPVGTTTNTFEVTDAAGNMASCSFDVVISDTEFPAITCPGDIAQDNDIGQCGAIINYTTPVGVDNCTGSITVQTAGLATGDLFPVGTTTNTFEVTDAAGNITSCSFDVVISDTELPTITCPADFTQNNDLDICGSIASYTVPVGLDNCTGSITTQIAGLDTGVEYPIGITTNTFEVIDLAGNSATCSFDVEIVDAQLPTIICSNSFESCDSVLIVEDPEIADNCPSPTFELTAGLPSESIFPVGITINEYTVTDASGNQATCEVEITRYALPVIDAGPDLTVDAGKVVTIDATGSNIDMYEWSPNEGLDDFMGDTPDASPMFTTEYSVLVTSEDGCEASDTVIISVNLVIEANNFMSPNGDGKNDTWIIKGNYLLDDCTIQIYSSWGNLVYESEGYDNLWDGTFKGSALPAGNFYFVISCEGEEAVSGSITLIR